MLLDAANFAFEALHGFLHATHCLLDDLGLLFPGTPVHELFNLIEFEAHVVKVRFNLRDLRPNFDTLLDRISYLGDTSLKFIAQVVPLLLEISVECFNFLFKFFHEKFCLQRFNIHCVS